MFHAEKCGKNVAKIKRISRQVIQLSEKFCAFSDYSLLELCLPKSIGDQ